MYKQKKIFQALKKRVSAVILEETTEGKFFMVKHIILWKLKEEYTEEQKAEIRQGIKAGLEGLAGVIPGLLSITVNADGRLASSNADVMLDSTFTDEAALKGYAVHPAHQEVANTKVRPFTETRLCLDFEL
jgi:hypothetical protein